MTSGLCNPEYYKGAFLEIQKSMEVREEGMEVQEEAACTLLVAAVTGSYRDIVQNHESTSSK